MSADTSENRLVVVALALVAVLVLLPIAGMGVGMMGFGHMGSGMWGGGMWSGLPVWVFLFGVIGQIVFLAILGFGAYLLYRAVTTDGETTDPALEELRQAYARGDLTDEEFERRREKLQREP